jgi:hypothetical protein
MPERVAAMTNDLFNHLLETEGPNKKALSFAPAPAAPTTWPQR